ncbi:MAG TPA: uroporphyrinogen decarboxylase family protein [Armatimonadota bacterium]
MATLRGEPVDRPAVSLYEIGGFHSDPTDPDPFNVYNDPSWLPLLQLAEERTDIIRMVSPQLTPSAHNPRDEYFRVEAYEEAGSRFTRTTLEIGGRTLTSLERRDRGVDTVWTLEHLLKDEDDVRAYLQLPDEVFDFEVSVDALRGADAAVGDRGIAMVDIGDPLCSAAEQFSMADYIMLAFAEPSLFHELLSKVARGIHERVRVVAKAFPGHLWRICGSEYAAEPYLPPRLFDEYVVRYDSPMIEAIRSTGGYPRIHCHGRVKNVAKMIVGMGAAALDPVEPPPQGDVTLAEMRRDYGRDLVLFGNLEASDIENMEPAEFEAVVATALREGTSGEGKGFVLMPSASPYGRTITERTMRNYETIVRLAEAA